jgi:hypothetical protein
MTKTRDNLNIEGGVVRNQLFFIQIDQKPCAAYRVFARRPGVEAA